MSLLDPDFRAFEGSTYVEDSPVHSFSGRKIYRYKLQNCNSQESIDSACQTINHFLEHNLGLFSFISASDGSMSLKEEVKAFPYLVINGKAVCLTDQSKALDDLDLTCRDVFFSEAEIEKPVQGSIQRHTFERKYAVSWKKVCSNVCPSSSNHELGFAEEEDAYLAEENRVKISSYNKNTTAPEEKDKLNATYSKELKKSHANNAISLSRHPAVQNAVSFTGGLKLGAKVSGSASKTFGKQLPFISVPIVSVLAIYRLLNGEKLKATGELLSGVSACFPGYGTAASIALDSALFLDDIRLERKGE